ncbi:MAG: hypothetical protein LBP51_06120 [Deferribacteraceae bacterium]|jgi:hypothetical protein|nr:hypothetical protein [Deferribacteraceae bacterium]
MAGESVVIANGGARQKNKCLIDAISEMQQMSAGEAMRAEMPKDFFTWSMQIEYFSIGLKAFLAGAVIIALLLPISIAASMGLIPIFGYRANIYDKIYMFILTFGVYGGGLFILVSCGKYVKGEYTRSIARALFSGAATAAIFKGAVLFVLYQLAQTLISPERVVKVVDYLTLPTNNTVYYMLLGNYKQIFRISSTIIIIFAAASIIAITVSYIIAIRKLSKIQDINDRYIKT